MMIGILLRLRPIFFVPTHRSLHLTELRDILRYYAINYKALKQALKQDGLLLPPNLQGVLPVQLDFDSLIDDSCDRLARFYKSKEVWAGKYMSVLNDNLVSLQRHRTPSKVNLAQMNISANDKDLKQKCIDIASNPHFKDYIYAVKSLRSFDTELLLLNEFIDLNYTGFGKILKKADKKRSTQAKESRLNEVTDRLPFLLTGGGLKAMRKT